jgi:hypothetical protein
MRSRWTSVLVVALVACTQHPPATRNASTPAASPASGGTLSVLKRPRSRCRALRPPPEAAEAIDKINVAARSYFQADHYDTSGNLLHKRFPVYTSVGVETGALVKTGWTPSTACCKQPGRRCAFDGAAWNKDIWRALMFQASDPIDFQISFESQGLDRRATYVARVRIDFGCAGAPCVFKTTGTIDNEFSVHSTALVLEP